jgi:KaiC/GvpD/RAD55 family RecA-like ATPase
MAGLDALLAQLPEDPKAAPLSTSNGHAPKPTRRPSDIDAVIDGPTPSGERNTTMWSLLSTMRARLYSESVIRAVAETLAQKWQYDAVEYTKLEDQLDRVMEWEPDNALVEDDGPDFLDITVDPTDLFLNQISEPRSSQVFTTGTPVLDNAINGGLYPSQLLYIAAAAWVGKSVEATQISYNAAQNGAEVMYVSTEASATEIYARIFAQIFLYPASRVLKMAAHRIVPDDLDQRMLKRWATDPASRALLQGLRRFEIREDLDSIDAIEKRIIARKLRGRPIQMLVADQLHDFSTPGLDGRFAIESISKGLRMLARKYNLTVIGCSQVNRGSDTAKIQSTEAKGDIWTPDVYNLRETEVLRHHAHVLVFLGRNYTENGDPTKMMVRVAKCRGAATLPSPFVMTYEPKYLRTTAPTPLPTTFPYVAGDDR